MSYDELIALGTAMALGALVGIQRERAHEPVAGIRTFTLITLLGALLAMVSQDQGPWILGAGLLGVTAILVTCNVLVDPSTRPADPGATTEIAGLVMYGVGAALASGRVAPAIVVGGSVAVLLQWKEPLHRLSTRIGEADFRALCQLVLLGLVILPALPNRPWGPYGVLNPFQIWLMVVLIVGLSLAAYVAYKLLGERVGTLLSGILGGLISSTATTVSYSRRTAEHPDMAPGATVVLALSSGVVFAILLEVYVVAPAFLPVLAPHLLVLMGTLALLAAAAWIAARGEPPSREPDEPPSTFRVALGFGLLYAAVLVAVAVAKQRFGDAGLYVVAVLSGLTDVDAITISTSQLVNAGLLGPEIGGRVIVVGALANLTFKLGVVVALGSPALRRRMVVVFGGALLVGAGVLARLRPPEPGVC